MQSKKQKLGRARERRHKRCELTIDWVAFCLGRTVEWGFGLLVGVGVRERVFGVGVGVSRRGSAAAVCFLVLALSDSESVFLAVTEKEY